MYICVCVWSCNIDEAVANEPHKAAAASTSPHQSKVELRNKPKVSQDIDVHVPPNKKAEFRQSGSGEPPVPKEAKFVKKHGALQTVTQDKRKVTKTSKTKLMAESGKIKKSEKKPKKGVVNPNAVQNVSSKQRKVSTEQKPRERKVSKTTKEKQAHGRKRENSSDKKKTDGVKQQKMMPLEPSNLKEQPDENIQVQPSSGSVENQPNSYELVADALAGKLIAEAITTQGNHKNSSMYP